MAVVDGMTRRLMSSGHQTRFNSHAGEKEVIMTPTFIQAIRGIVAAGIVLLLTVVLMAWVLFLLECHSPKYQRQFRYLPPPDKPVYCEWIGVR